MNVGPGHVRFEPERVLFTPTVWGWLRGGRPVRLRYDHIRGVEMQRRHRAGRLVVTTTCTAEPFVLEFGPSRTGDVVSAAHELAARLPAQRTGSG